MSENQIIILGSSSGLASAKRSCSSFVLETSDGIYLFDCGEGTTRSLLQNEVDLERINNIFISHGHSDHFIGLPILLQYYHLKKRREELNVFLPSELVLGLKNLLNVVYLFPEELPFILNLIPIRKNPIFENSSLKVEAFLNSHLVKNQNFIQEQNLPNKMESFSFVINLSGRKIVYSGDIASLADLEKICLNVDVLLTECMHVEIEKILELAQVNKVKRIIFTHIPDELEDKLETLQTMFAKYGLEEVKFAFDGMVIEL
jgi:ribonuclease BN (tRNA processing enzyme)